MRLASRTGWQKKAWHDGDWDIAAGQYFKNFHPDIHVFGENRPDPKCFAEDGTVELKPGLSRAQFCDELARLRRFRESGAVEWFAAMDYGYTHLTAVVLACRDHQGNVYVVDEHAERHWIPQRHAGHIKAMLARHNIFCSKDHLRETLLARYPDHCSEREALWHQLQKRMLHRFVAGADMFGSQSNGDSVAKQYGDLGLSLRPANMDRAYGWSVIGEHLGDPPAGILPSLFIHERCKRLIECLPYLQHDPDRPGDVLKSNINEEGTGGDDPADALRYAIATRPAVLHRCRLTGW